MLQFSFAFGLRFDGRLFLKTCMALRKDGAAQKMGKGGAGGSGLCGAVISSVQMRTCFRLWDASPSQDKDSSHLLKRIMGTLFVVYVLGERK